MFLYDFISVDDDILNFILFCVGIGKIYIVLEKFKQNKKLCTGIENNKLKFDSAYRYSRVCQNLCYSCY